MGTLVTVDYYKDINKEKEEKTKEVKEDFDSMKDKLGIQELRQKVT